MAELVDATDLKSVGTLLPCRFDSGFPHHKKTPFQRVFFYGIVPETKSARACPVRSRACASGRSKDGFSTRLKNKLPRNLHSGFPPSTS